MSVTESSPRGAAPPVLPARGRGDRLNEWLDRNARHIFLWPAVLLILIFSIFPLVASLVIAFARIRLSGGGFRVRFVDWRNFEKLLFGSEQFHLLGTFGAIGPLGWAFGLGATAGVIWWIVSHLRSGWTGGRLLGRLFP